MRKSVFLILSTRSDTFLVMCSSQMATYHTGQKQFVWLHSDSFTIATHKQKSWSEWLYPFLQYEILSVVNDNIGIVFPTHLNLRRYE